MRTQSKMAFLAGVLLLTGCAGGYNIYQDPYGHTKVGAGIGAVTGAIVGHQIDDDDGGYVGGAAGALVGGAVGNYMDRQQQANQRTLAEERYRNEQLQSQGYYAPYSSEPAYSPSYPAYQY